MPSRTRQSSFKQRFTEQSWRFNNGTPNFIVEDAQRNEEDVQVQWNENLFPKSTAESKQSRGTAGTARVAKISIDLDHYSSLKKWLEVAETPNTFHASSVDLWKDDVVRLKKELNDVFVATKCLPRTPDDIVSLPSSALWNIGTRRKVDRRNFRHHQVLKRGLTVKDVPYTLCSLFFFSQLLAVAHSFMYLRSVLQRGA